MRGLEHQRRNSPLSDGAEALPVSRARKQHGFERREDAAGLEEMDEEEEDLGELSLVSLPFARKLLRQRSRRGAEDAADSFAGLDNAGPAAKISGEEAARGGDDAALLDSVLFLLSDTGLPLQSENREWQRYAPML